jgi:hypothetical protein
MAKYTVSYKVNGSRTHSMEVFATTKDEARMKAEDFIECEYGADGYVSIIRARRMA